MQTPNKITYILPENDQYPTSKLVTVEQSRSLASQQSLRAGSLKLFLGAQEIHLPYGSFFLAQAMMSTYQNLKYGLNQKERINGHRERIMVTNVFLVFSPERPGNGASDYILLSLKPIRFFCINFSKSKCRPLEMKISVNIV